MGFFVSKVNEKVVRYGQEITVEKTRYHYARIIVAAFVVFSLILFSFLSITSVPVGHTGVVTTFGRVENYTLDSGFHIKNPFSKVIKMDNRIQKSTVQLCCFSSDIQEVNVVFTLNHQINKEYAMNIYRTIGRKYYDTAIAPIITESVKTVAARYTAEDLINKRNEFSSAVEVDMKEKLSYYNIELVSSSVEDMDFTDVFTNAVEAKQVAAQNKLRAETETAQAILEAEAEAEIRRVTVEAEAYEILHRAEAEAEANKKLASSLSQEILEKMYYDKWNGILPETVLSGETGIMVPVS